MKERQEWRISMRKTKIVCTLGPATDNEEVLRQMMLEGMNVARCNFSHATYDEHKKRMDMIKKYSKKIGNAQRMFLQYFYRELLNEESDSYADLLKATENAYRKYDSQVN